MNDTVPFSDVVRCGPRLHFMTGLYILAFVLIFLAYYGFHFLAYGN